jgi:putative flippase GtrA
VSFYDYYQRLKKVFNTQEVRFLIAGGWNTLFGYAVYAIPYYFLHKWVHYMVIAVVGNVFAITMAYVTHKFFVFRTKGNVLREYVKFIGVYGVTTVIGLTALPFCVEILKFSPYIAPLFILVVTTVISFLGHKYFSFKHKTARE